MIFKLNLEYLNLKRVEYGKKAIASLKKSNKKNFARKLVEC